MKNEDKKETENDDEKEYKMVDEKREEESTSTSFYDFEYIILNLLLAPY